MTEEQLMLNFGALSLSVLGLGAFALAWLTWWGHGSRFFAILLSLTSLGMGVYFLVNLADAGWIPTLLGVGGIIFSIIPGRKHPEKHD
jgi:ABC-type glycerol-3-phosphate transport system permease component